MQIEISRDEVLERFIKYIKIDSQSDATSNTTPSTEKQWNMVKLLEEDLNQIGMQDVHLDKNGYLMATLPATTQKQVSCIGFVAHYDTSPDFNATGINPQIHENYDGKDIVLNAEKNIVLSPDYFEDLQQYKGQTIITTDGTTLLSADDKAGVTEIVSAMKYLIEHPEIEHGKIRICFTPDEEIGRGAHKFDVEKFGAKWAYTMDGSEIGELEYENFNAAAADIYFKGKIVHPGYAKGKMINSMYLASQFIQALPADEVPEKTTGKEGFFHLSDIKGEVEETHLHYIIRDHDKKLFEARKQKVIDEVKKMQDAHGKENIVLEMKDQYYNMREKIEPVMHIIDIAEKAMLSLDIKPNFKAIRGGTDGSQLSYMGLPCPNIFAGGHNFHGKYEYVPLESMLKATQVIVKIAEITTQEV
ncbi:peptidase T [Psychroflexus planctonicus]|uniref:Peptidase T n=1 Tax=Psychroflexus planctonicus TaxID=1526575 RepID=A0ABQ1SJC4_9FLAO|nr:peptidase T [Psychroflexus planctonicus]GGE36859.1 peptidase T [Psychroflexus planctonicus]